MGSPHEPVRSARQRGPALPKQPGPRHTEVSPYAARTLHTWLDDPMRDRTHEQSVAWNDCRDWLLFKKNEGLATRSLDAYEKAVAILLRAFPDKTPKEFTEFDVM